jgi:hypothetical protein
MKGLTSLHDKIERKRVRSLAVAVNLESCNKRGLEFPSLLVSVPLRENCEMRRKSEHQCTRFLSNKRVITKFLGGLTGLHSKDQSFRGGRESAGSNFAEMSSAAL